MVEFEIEDVMGKLISKGLVTFLFAAELRLNHIYLPCMSARPFLTKYLGQQLAAALELASCAQHFFFFVTKQCGEEGIARTKGCACMHAYHGSGFMSCWWLSCLLVDR